MTSHGNMLRHGNQICSRGVYVMHIETDWKSGMMFGIGSVAAVLGGNRALDRIQSVVN